MANRTTLKTYFETGDIPTQSQFSDLIDSSVPNGGAELTTLANANSFPILDSGTLKNVSFENLKTNLNQQSVSDFVDLTTFDSYQQGIDYCIANNRVAYFKPMTHLLNTNLFISWIS